MGRMRFAFFVTRATEAHSGYIIIALVNTQNVTVTKIVDCSSIQRAENKHGFRIQFLALVVMIYEVWLNA
jgi:hypothetical protein